MSGFASAADPGRVRSSARRLGTAPLMAAWLVALTSGCGGPPIPAQSSPGGTGQEASPAARGMRDQLLGGAVAVLSALDRYDARRGSEQVFDRLVQWQHAAPPIGPAEPPQAAAVPLEQLPEGLRTAAGDVPTRGSFDAAGDVAALRDRCWLAAIARTARGDAADDLAVAENLFRWTVRSLAPASDPPMVPSDAVPGSRWFLPGEILLAGRASGPQRAWIFLELLRQAGLDGVMLATPATAGAAPRPWLPAAVIGGEAYLFEPTYGMAVPGPGGRGVATARQAAADPSILRALSLPERRYPVQADDLAEGIEVLVLADPWSIAPRMIPLDRDLAAAHGIRVAADAEAVAGRAMGAVPGRPGRSALIWTFPWETVARRDLAAGPLEAEVASLEMPMPDPEGRRRGFRPLFAGRVREFRGEFEGPAGAKAAYLAARPSRQAVAAAVAGMPPEQAAEVTGRLVRMKEDATYWLGLLMLAEGADEAAVDYLGRMTLEATPDSRWADAARLGLAAALAALGRDSEAAALLRSDGSPQRFGSRLLADRLESDATPASP